MNDRQIICETHSEYLVTRLRLLVAADRISYGEGLRVHFVERRDGASTVREVRFGKRGEVPDWPEGFFDQSAIDAADLVRAATKSG
jgi:predicted ATPase